MLGPASDDREFFFFFLDDIDDADDGEHEQDEIREPEDYQQRPQEWHEDPAQDPQGDFDAKEHQPLLDVEFYECVILCNEERDEDQDAEISEHTHDRLIGDRRCRLRALRCLIGTWIGVWVHRLVD